MNKIFIYGTLGPGGPNEHVMKKIGGEWKAASVKGFLRAEGWGADMGYPGLVADEAGEDIQGHIFISNSLTKHLSYLDEFEGDGYERIEIIAYLENDESTRAYTYALKI